jgi:AcrR family transcriptional regulator
MDDVERASTPSGATNERDERAPTNGNGADGPRRSSLAQARSRRTRQKLVNAAVKLWTERGFENGPETTTVEEIARAAGVTKGTFYFHFAHKEDVLLEMSITTSAAMAEVAERAGASGARIDDVVLEAFNEMARRTERMPRAAIARTIRAFYKYPDRVRDLSMTRQVFPGLFKQAQARGELPAGVDPVDLADMFNALMITAVEGWVHGDHDALGPEMAYRTRVLFAGVRAEHAE